MNKKLSHIDKDGNASMVDISNKNITDRRAIAQSIIEISQETFKLLEEKAIPKGDVLNTAKIAGILAAKNTSNFIPLCHPLNIGFIDISFELNKEKSQIIIKTEVKASDKTGLEMEALVGCQIAALTIYDMCKSVQKDIKIKDCRLLYKSGGKSGIYENS